MTSGQPLSDPPPLARSTLDKAAHRRTDPQWLAESWQRSRVLVLATGGRALVVESTLVLVDAATAESLAPEAERVFLGVDGDDVPHFAVVGELPDRPGARVLGVREVGHLLPDFDAGLLMTAVALTNWHLSHRYAPTSGLATSPGEGGWVRADGAGATIFPRTDPAVIVLVHDGVDGENGRCLLGHNASWARGGAGGVKRYSCLAGFVEPGESAEQTVLREVFEEVGVRIGGLRYAGSQSWPYPGSLMLGYFAVGDPADPVRVDPTEIADARWFTRTEIRAAVDGDASVGFGVAPPASIAHYLITGWLSA